MSDFRHMMSNQILTLDCITLACSNTVRNFDQDLSFNVNINKHVGVFSCICILFLNLETSCHRVMLKHLDSDFSLYSQALYETPITYLYGHFFLHLFILQEQEKLVVQNLSQGVQTGNGCSQELNH